MQMKFYIDITLLPSDEIGVHFLWTKVMTQVHLALVEIQDGNQKVPVAVSFPQYREKQDKKQGFIGKKLRLLAVGKTDLERLNLEVFFSRLLDYVHIKTISDVPSTNTYESFSRKKVIGTVDRLIRRRMERYNETIEQAKKYFVGYESKAGQQDLPFIQMKSLNSQHHFCLSIVRKNKTNGVNTIQEFNTYGLSSNGALPKF